MTTETDFPTFFRLVGVLADGLSDFSRRAEGLEDLIELADIIREMNDAVQMFTVAAQEKTS